MTPALEEALAARPDDGATWRVVADLLLERGVEWGDVISAAVQGSPELARQRREEIELLGDLDGRRVTTWANGVIASLDLRPAAVSEPGLMEATLERALKHPAGHFVRHLVLGLPPSHERAWHLEGLVGALSNAGPLPLLETLDLSVPAPHMDQRSWRRIGDISSLWKAAPRLRELLLEGSRGVDGGKAVNFGDIAAPCLEKLVITSGGLSQWAPQQLGAATFPKLKHLELSFGRVEYGNTCTVPMLDGLLSGRGLPVLDTLGLKNSEWEVELLLSIAHSPLLARLRALDLSLGVLASEGAATLINLAPKFAHLDALILGENYFSSTEAAALKQALPNAQVGWQKPLSADGTRYPTVGE